ncbi:MAG TPA: hypothetical protein VI386_00520, partial [Candidatus Sulfotelmatobacter sp.]
DDWSAPGISIEQRQRFIRHRWILTVTTTKPGQIDAMMTIHLNYAGSGVTARLVSFTERVLPILVAKPAITSIYRGTGHSIAVDFVLRLTASKEQLFDIIEEIHKLAGQEKILITTTTYLVMRKLSSLDLAAACLSRGLPPEDAYYWNRVVMPALSPEERERAKEMPTGRRTAFIISLRQLQRAIERVAQKTWAPRLKELAKQSAPAFLFDDILATRELHDLLQERVEGVLAELAARHVSEAELDSWRQMLQIAPGRVIKSLTYTERIKLLKYATKSRQLSGLSDEHLGALMTTTQVRNAFAHGKRDELDETKVVRALDVYTAFLASREEGETRPLKLVSGA